MEKQAQSDKFQEAMQQLVGQHLIDSIRTQLKQKEAEHRKERSAKNTTKGQIHAVRILEVTKISPPTPTSMKPTKDKTPAKKVQGKSVVPAKNSIQTNNAMPTARECVHVKKKEYMYALNLI
ncbi:hypothetical protein PF004_g8573 [Phytophthora fragariae]|uniref:Uncharacterized protein n=1 Tax=Phytophthora fragariae TaxID=53985 RepID=A0A6A3F3X6_9STRA|nr:hypothetical protein PF009_g10110 [Phytophthora fragariae]KAE9237465.1 hypothetical protein PF004_g8573 [Phytophthora fragariae]